MLAEIVIQFKKAVIRMRSSQNERCEKHKQFHSVHYEQAKHAETSERNLLKALTLYLQATWAGEKIDSCIKDFASVMHQLGETAAAV